MHGVDEAGVENLPDGGGPAAEPDVLALRCPEEPVGVAGKTRPEQFQTYMQVSGPRRVRVPVPRPLDRAVRGELPAAPAGAAGARSRD